MGLTSDTVHTMVKLIEEIKSRLDKYAGVRYESDGSSITVFPNSDDGFEVNLTINNGDSYLVSFDAWHEEMDSENEAVNLFALGLSNECRLKEYRRGSYAYKWTSEFLEEGEWKEYSTTALLLFPFWMKSNVRYRQNDLIKLKRDST